MEKKIKSGFPEKIYVAEEEVGTYYDSFNEISSEYDIDIKVAIYELKEIGFIRKTFKFEKE